MFKICDHDFQLEEKINYRDLAGTPVTTRKFRCSKCSKLKLIDEIDTRATGV